MRGQNTCEEAVDASALVADDTMELAIDFTVPKKRAGWPTMQETCLHRDSCYGRKQKEAE